MDQAETLRERAERLATEVFWHHSIKLFPDFTTKGGKSIEVIEAETGIILGPLRLEGRSVIDIGAWNGHFSFESKRRGADRVVAVDSFTWKHPSFRGRETFDLARECLDLDVEAVEMDVVELPRDLGQFDVVLFLGVFYHLPDPLAVLQNVAAMARDVLVIETDLALSHVPHPAMRFWPRSELGHDITNWWSPNAECMYELLRSMGFGHICFQWHPYSTQRGVFHAFRTSQTAVPYLMRGADNVTMFELDGRDGRERIFASSAVMSEALPPAATTIGLRRKVAELGAELAEKQRELQRVKQSVSWRVTRPFRLLAKEK